MYIETGIQQYIKYPIPDKCNYTACLIIDKLRVILFGTSIGSIRVYLWPWAKAGN